MSDRMNARLVLYLSSCFVAAAWNCRSFCCREEKNNSYSVYLSFAWRRNI
ncbi:hypothetical protein HMPREF7215_1895 [Pyramidobacter piscolens W5455]|uniref:Uncharacterized protein n=1 Tax=Pyramidobacter piscolens W5455 TaxID=352165 RepID=A0ABM9ZX17_9BACT|nr:hypothetical protein HMPREF7215_1895 [Pyramidobacter piscolens W5455]